jgi:hypothetical protein
LHWPLVTKKKLHLLRLQLKLLHLLRLQLKPLHLLLKLLHPHLLLKPLHPLRLLKPQSNSRFWNKKGSLRRPFFVFCPMNISATLGIFPIVAKVAGFTILRFPFP